MSRFILIAWLLIQAAIVVGARRRETSFESDEKDFTEWSAFTICSATCGEGFKKRTRKCTRRYCTGRTIEQQTCKLADCPVYSNWFASTPCSKTCGFGIQERMRFCLSDSPLCSKEETKMISICKMEKCNNDLILSPSRLNDLRIDRVQKDEGELLSRIKDRKIKRVKDLYERKKIPAITGGTKAPEQSYKIQHSYDEDNSIKFLLKPFEFKEHYSSKTLVYASQDHGLMGLTYLVCAILLQIALHVFTYLYIYRKGCCIKKVHESFGKNRRRRTFKDTAKFILGQAATNWILRKTKTILKRPPVSNRRNIDNMFNRQQGEYDEKGYLLGRPLREMINEDVEINMDHFDSSILKSSFDAIHANIKEDLNGCMIPDSSPHTEPQSERNFTSPTSIIDNTELHLCEHVKTGNLIDFGNEKIDGCLIRQSSDPLHDSLDLDDGNSLDMHDGKYHSYKEPVDHDSVFILHDINFDVESAYQPYSDDAEHLAHQGQSSTNECDINKMPITPPTIKSSFGPPPKEVLNITAPYGNSDPGCDKMSEIIPYSGTPASNGKDMNSCNNAVQNDDIPPQESPNLGGDVREDSKNNLSAKYTSPIPTITETTRNETRNNIHSRINDTLKDENFVEKTVDHKGANKPKITAKSLGGPSINNVKIENIDDTLKQSESKKSTRSLQTPTKRSRFSFFRRKNKSSECLETEQSKETKKKTSRSFFSWFRKKKSSKQDRKNCKTVSRPENNYFVITKRYTKDFQLDPSPCKDVDQCVTKVASCHNLRSVSTERLKWESRTRTASLNDLGSEVIKESSRFL